MFDNVSQLREVFPHDIWVNPRDARAAGVHHGDTVLVSSRFGQITRRIKVTKVVMPGVVVLGQGAWSRVNEEGIDTGGNANTLQGSYLTGEGHCTWNTSLIRIDPWDEIDSLADSN